MVGITIGGVRLTGPDGQICQMRIVDKRSGGDYTPILVLKNETHAVLLQNLDDVNRQSSLHATRGHRQVEWRPSWRDHPLFGGS